MDENQVETKVVDDAKVDQQKSATPEAQAAVAEETPQQIDWKRFKEARKIERQQREEAEKSAAKSKAEADALKAALEAVVNKPSSNSGSDTEESEDERLQKKISVAMEARDRQLQQQRLEVERKELPQRLAKTYPDFEKVCSDENIDYLKFHYPNVANAFNYVPENFDTWTDFYHTIKKLVPNTDTRNDMKRVEKNVNKPQSMSTAGVTQTGDHAPRMLDDKMKSDNWARMQKRMKGIA